MPTGERSKRDSLELRGSLAETAIQPRLYDIGSLLVESSTGDSSSGLPLCESICHAEIQSYSFSEC